MTRSDNQKYQDFGSFPGYSKIVISCSAHSHQRWTMFITFLAWEDKNYYYCDRSHIIEVYFHMEIHERLRKNREFLLLQYNSNLEDVLDLQDTLVRDILPSMTDELELCPEAVKWTTDWLSDTCVCLLFLAEVYLSADSLLSIYLPYLQGEPYSLLVTDGFMTRNP